MRSKTLSMVCHKSNETFQDLLKHFFNWPAKVLSSMILILLKERSSWLRFLSGSSASLGTSFKEFRATFSRRRSLQKLRWGRKPWLVLRMQTIGNIWRGATYPSWSQLVSKERLQTWIGRCFQFYICSQYSSCQNQIKLKFISQHTLQMFSFIVVLVLLKHLWILVLVAVWWLIGFLLACLLRLSQCYCTNCFNCYYRCWTCRRMQRGPTGCCQKDFSGNGKATKSSSGKHFSSFLKICRWCDFWGHAWAWLLSMIVSVFFYSSLDYSGSRWHFNWCIN